MSEGSGHLSGSLAPTVIATSERILETWYGGKRCILTSKLNTVEWAHLAARAQPGLDALIHELYDKQLLPPGTTHLSPENLIPLESNSRIMFDNNTWTIFPVMEVLLRYIKVAELDLIRRERYINSRMSDPGRAPYQVPQDPMELFDVFAKPILDDVYRHGLSALHTFKNGNLRGDPPIPPIRLGASVAIVVCTRLGALFEMTSADPDILAQMNAGHYLKLLWDAHPSTFRQLLRPQIHVRTGDTSHWEDLPISTPPPSSGRITVPPLASQSTGESQDGGLPETTMSMTPPTLPLTFFPLDDGEILSTGTPPQLTKRSVTDTTSELQLTPPTSPTSKKSPSEPVHDGGVMAFTSRMWALKCYGVDLEAAVK